MDGDWYVVEKMIRSRVAEAQARARWAALLDQSAEPSRQSNRTRSRFVHLGRALVDGLWSELAHWRARNTVERPSRTVRSDRPQT